MLRATVFWVHLATGVTAGLVVLMMAVTGVVLTYERQLLAATAATLPLQGPNSRPRIPLDDLISIARSDGFEPTEVVAQRDPGAPVQLRAGRTRSLLLDPHTGAQVVLGNERLSAFLDAVTRWHRWFDAGEENRSFARAITGASNLAFLFLLLSGAYLWLPRVFTRTALRARVWFKGGTPAQRDFNWHHVIGLWCLIPLLVIVATATVFGYGWANRLVYAAVGETPPVRNAAPPATAHASNDAFARLPLEPLHARGVAEFERELGDWNTVTTSLPGADAHSIELRFDQGNGGQPQHRHALTLDVRSGEVVDWSRFDDQSAGARLRSWIRFLHTGEALGPAGQTAAGLASLGAVFMVWTGLSLSWRRLRRFRTRRRTRMDTTSRLIGENPQ